MHSCNRGFASPTSIHEPTTGRSRLWTKGSARTRATPHSYPMASLGACARMSPPRPRFAECLSVRCGVGSSPPSVPRDTVPAIRRVPARNPTQWALLVWHGRPALRTEPSGRLPRAREIKRERIPERYRRILEVSFGRCEDYRLCRPDAAPSMA